jgi:hypothetical protein
VDDDSELLARSLINPTGESFASEIEALSSILGAFDNTQRLTYRNRNATDISIHTADRLLIVAGPGSGKSHLFLSRIQHWLPSDSEALVYVSSFVRKLVKDLQADVEKELSEDDQARVTVTTLHGLSLSLLERSRGTKDRPLQRHINVIAGPWPSMVWDDVREFHTGLDGAHSLHALEKQFHTEEYDPDPTWRQLVETYFALCRFYNAVGFSDMVVLARTAVDESPELNNHLYWIIDEFQDFNVSEDHLIRSLTSVARGVLLAGDDEQALYQQLKSSLPEIIISYYDDPRFANAMLPYCSRCSYYVCLAASAFISNGRPVGTIEKIYLPLEVDESAAKVKVVATAAPSSAVDYIQKFVRDHQSELDDHVARMEAGKETDPFLLILTPQRDARFYNTSSADQNLKTWLSQWKPIDTGHSEDYRLISTYCSAGWDPSGNLALRKVLHYEAVPTSEVHPLLEAALREACSLSDIDSPLVRTAIEKCVAIAAIVDNAELANGEKVDEIGRLISIAHPDELVREMDLDPLSGGVIAVDEEAEEAIQTAGAAAAVEMMTIVGSKGLSAKHVIVIGCDDVNLARTSRLTFFVGLTRARDSLHLVMSAKAGGSTSAHGFLGELPGDCCEFIVYKKTGSQTEAFTNFTQWASRIASWGQMARRFRR